MLDIVFIFGAKYLFLISLAIVSGYFLYVSKEIKRQMIITSVIALPLILIITQITSHFYYDPRPFVVGNFTPLVPHDPDNGFPSDHTLLTMYVAALVYPHTKKIAYLLLVLAIMVGLSRVYVGIHHLTDVVGSTVIVLVAISGAYYLCDQKLKSISLPWLQ